MIPLRLELTNFLSYRETATLDFSGLHLAGIAGPNGAGKSSIMEAMTWALFGRSRARSDDDLINRQARDGEAAEVRFVFELEGVAYRIIRRKSPAKTTILELQMATGDGGWKPLSESKIRETQAAIEDLLRMNYDTFVNASFLLQGKADQFTTRTPSQRKEILAELLGVTQWDAYRERAAAARKETEGSIAILDARLEEFANELAEETARREALAEAISAHAQLKEKRALKEQLLNEARRQEDAVKQIKKNIADLAGQDERARRSLEQSQANLTNRRQRAADLALIVERAAETESAYARWQALDEQVNQQQKRAARHHALLQAMQPYKVEIAQTLSRLEQEQKALRAQEAQAAAARAEQEKLVQDQQAQQAQLAELQQAVSLLRQKEEELNEARAALQHIQGERQLWQQELEQLQATSEAMEDRAREQKEAQRTQSEVQALLATLDERIGVIREQQETYNQLLAETQALQAQQPTLKKEMELLKGRVDNLEAAEAGGPCPLCEQPLSETHRQTVIATIRADGKHHAEQYRANEARLKSLAVELPQIKKTLDQGAALERDRQAQQRRLAEVEARLAELSRAQSDWSRAGEKRLIELAALLAEASALAAQTELVSSLEAALADKAALQESLQAQHAILAASRARQAENERLLTTWETDGSARLRDVSQQLHSGAFAAAARQELAALEAQLADVAYDQDAHQSAESKKAALADVPAAFQALNQARAALQPLQEAIADLEQQIGEAEREKAARQVRLDETRAQLAALEADGIDVKALEDEVFVLREAELERAQSVGRAQQTLDVLDNLRTMRDDYLQERETLMLRVQRLSLLEKSCGRNGVQALLIEYALPEIEEEANDLLDRLTGGEMRIKFDTQRQLKSRDAQAETLDIIISDRAGERPYDNYSGGEQFRINFAIRLALSKLLANRAGARLQTLVIDEGFGSQDPQGRQRLIEAINAVQKDFACVLVITHIDELREVFPTRIEVQKEADGSQITVR